MRLLMVCLGNICRSPLAEGALRTHLDRHGLDWVQVDSAGTGDWHAGQAPDRRSIAVAAGAGVDIARQRARQLVRGDFDHFDWLLCADRSVLRDVRALAPPDARARAALLLDWAGAGSGDIPDPYTGGATDFAHVWTLVDTAAAAVAARLATPAPARVPVDARMQTRDADPVIDSSPAPEFPASLEWLNLARPLRMAQLRGRITALVFVNAGSAWSQQRLVDLATLRKRHSEHLHVVAIHVPRFDHERDGKRAFKRLHRVSQDIPIAHDADWVAWQHYGIDAWPTVVLIDGQGRLRERIVGDTPVRELEARIAKLRGEDVPQSLNADPIELRRNREPDLPLCYPMGIAVSQQYLYVVDSGHHRVLECTHAGRIQRQFGSGGPGFIDGPMELAAFQAPQGLCLQRDVLYVADTGNHAVRRIKLSTGDVDTLCGAGRPGQPHEGVVHDPRAIALDQPRGVAVSPSNLVCIATAGDNRIWAFDLGDRSLKLLAGSGAMDLIDGEGEAAAFAGPSGLAIVQQILYVCDEAGSAIRSVHLRTRQVTTLVGQGAWSFGNVEGSRTDALLQQPQALSLDGTTPVLWVADSGNDQLRTLRLGGGEVGTISLPQRLHAPAGLAVFNGIVWIADTDAHAVLRFDPGDGSLRQIPIGE